MTSRLSRRFAVLAAVALVALAASVRSQTPAPPRPAPSADALPPGAWKESVLYGRALFTETFRLIGPEVSDAAMRHAGNNLSCQSCHLAAGTQPWGMPMTGVHGLFPTFSARENGVRTIEDRIQGCMERSMNGRPLPLDGKEMKAMVAYLAFLSEGVPPGKPVEGRGTPSLALLDRAADPARGATVYVDRCIACHQPEGRGLRKGKVGDAAGYIFPPLWGPDSFNDGAGMHRLIASASFIRANMPFGVRHDAPLLSVEEAWDVAAHINSQPRPSRANRDRDYPDRARKPVDAPFPPFADDFPLIQHQLGPFGPMLDARQKRDPR